MNTYFGYIYNVLCLNIFNCLGNQPHFRQRYDYTTNNYTDIDIMAMSQQSNFMRMDNDNNDDNNVNNDNNTTIIDIDDENSFMIRGNKFHIDNDFIK